MVMLQVGFLAKVHLQKEKDMRLVSFYDHGKNKIGALLGDKVLDFSKACPQLPCDMIQFLGMEDEAKQTARIAINNAKDTNLILEKAINYLPVVINPEKILCIGHNYKGHIGIGRTELPEYPNFFCKTANTLIGHRGSVVLPNVTEQLDYEAELAVIIGKSGKNIPEAKAYDHIAGYSIFNDVSARDLQKRTNQWFIGKSLDTFAPLGPALVTLDEVPDPHCLDLDLSVNGVSKQHATTADLIISIPYLVHFLSEMMTLKVGDVIATGTPAKLPEAANPQQFLKKGDFIEIKIDPLGMLVNSVS